MYPGTLIKIPCLTLFPLNSLSKCQYLQPFLASILSYLTRVNIEMTFFLSILEYLLLFLELQETGWVRESFSYSYLTFTCLCPHLSTA